jgi:YrbI family 3-deoxy-D-manno-octulosonate 8-phosphate phosphatase
MDCMVTTRPEVLAIIPARGGSKGLPRKNIRCMAGHPLISYSIAAGLQARSVTRTIVTTDDEEIAAVSRQYGAEIPFMRPAEFAQDNTLDLPVFQHALNWLAEHEGYHPDVVVQLRPTSPIRPPELVDQAVGLLLANSEADSVRGLVPSGQNPHKMWRVDPVTNRMHNLLDVPGVPEPYNAPRQILPQIYWQTGHVDAIRPQVILQQASMSGANILALMIESRYTVDIDGLLDLQKAEWLIYTTGLPMVHPGHARRALPEKVSLIVFDFDGVMTDNRVWVDQEGRESVAANRSDSLGLELLRTGTSIRCFVLSKETNPVVTARCRKLGIPVLQAVDDKPGALRKLFVEQGIDPAEVIYMGNDINDLPCFPLAGCAVVPADAQPQVLFEADVILGNSGGHGAVRELCDLLLARYNR